MKKFVFWSGIYDIVMAGTLACPWVVRMMGVTLPESYFWLWFAAALVMYLGVVLVISSRDIKARAPVIYWEGILRLVGFVLMAGFGIFGGLGLAVALLGVVDLVIGLVYLVGLPRALKTTPLNILLDR